MKTNTFIDRKSNFGTKGFMDSILNKIPATYIGLIMATLSISIFLSFASPYFFNITNFINIGNQIAINIIIATGMTIVICSGGIDLSVGSNVALTGTIVALYFYIAGNSPFAIFLGLIVGIGVGLIIGFLNGFLVSIFNIPPFITTLGTMGVVRGLTLVFSGGRLLCYYSGVNFNNRRFYS